MVSWFVLACSLAGAQTTKRVFVTPAPGIFVTPIPNAPFSGTISVERTALQADGSTAQFWSVRRIARDSQGRIYNEFRPLVPASMTATPQVIRIHLYDPQNRVTEYLYPQRKVYSATILNRPPRSDTTQGFASPSAQGAPPSEFTQREDLGYKTLAGLEVHGVRVTQTLPAEESGTGKEVVVTDEYWYSESLRLNLEIVHIDPRSGSDTQTMTDLDVNEPDAALFEVPSDYTMAGQSVAPAQ
jgi:hypothetical protein